jgi:hypothetical protein
VSVVGRFCRRLWIGIQDLAVGGHAGGVARLRIRFRVPKGFTLDERLAELRLIGLFKGKRRKGRPDLLLSVMRYPEPVRTIEQAAALHGDRAREGRRVVSSGVVRVGGGDLARQEILDELEGTVTVTLARPLEGLVWGCGGESREITLETAAATVLNTLEAEAGEGEARSDGWIEVRSHGYALKPPAGWERMDMAGQVLLFAPGTGFRPRVSFDSPDPEADDWEPAKERLEAWPDHLALIHGNVRAERPRPFKAGGKSGYRLDFRAFLKRKEADIRGRLFLIPVGRRGLEAQYLALDDDTYEASLLPVLAMLRDVRWLP